jgi:anti-sigma factor (TIGR02949 family)
MPCSKVVALLFDYLEGRLAPEERSRLDAHLAECPSCVAHLRTYRCTVSLLGSLSEEDLPEELRARLTSFLERGARN